jgi:3'(2'), 5'-bisphosphate nucleotidase
MTIHLLNRTTIDALAGIAIEAGQAVMQIYDEPEAWNLEVKGDTSPLTHADLRANEIIVAALARLTPEIPVLSEESPWTGGDVATYWAVDPLDGTKEFLKRNGEFTVNIALVVGGVTRMGVICAPALKTIWAGLLGDLDTEPSTGYAARTHLPDISVEAVSACHWQPISVQVASTCGRAVPIRLVGSRSHGGAAYPDWVAQLIPEAITIERGSSLKFCLIAQGDADVYIRMGPTCTWDTAAGQAILSAAGGKVLALESGSELTYSNPERVINPSFIAATPILKF